MQIRIDDIKIETVLNSMPLDEDIDYKELWHAIIDDFNELKSYIHDHVLGLNNVELIKGKCLINYIESISRNGVDEISNYHVDLLTDMEAGIFMNIARAIRKIIGSATLEYMYMDHYYQGDDIVLLLGYVDLNKGNVDRESYLYIDKNFKRLLNVGIKNYGPRN